MPQGLPGPWMDMIRFGIRSEGLYNYTWKRNNLAGRGGRDRHLYSHVFEAQEDQFGKSAILHLLGNPKQLQVLVPHAIVVLVITVHSGLQKKLIVYGFKLATERKHAGKLAGNMLDQLFVFD